MSAVQDRGGSHGSTKERHQGNGFGELGLGDTSSRGDAAGEMGTSLPVVDLGAGMTATAISIGGFSTCALLNTAAVKCWGQNLVGTLGIGDTNNRGDSVGEMGDLLPTVYLGDRSVKAVAVNGDGSVCATLDSNQLKCWGRNQMGQLGLGDTSDRGDAPHELGDNLPVVDLGLDVQDSQ